MSEIKKGIYKHYKGNMYEVLEIAKHSETLEDLVIYKALYESKDYGKDTLWVRPISMFFESIKVEDKLVPRFEYTPSYIDNTK